MATCPECDAEIDIDEDEFEELQAGDAWECDACGSLLRVATVEPLEFESDEEDDEEEEVAEAGETAVADDEDGDFDDDEDEDDDGEDWDE